MPIRCYATSEHKGCQVPEGHETRGVRPAILPVKSRLAVPAIKNIEREADFSRSICYNGRLHCVA